MKYWHQLEIGERLETRSCKIDAGEVREFAAEFDPQPYHLDQEAAQASIFGGLCASGWQVNALSVRLISDTINEQGFALMGVRRVKQCRWKRPSFVGDSMRATLTLTDKCDDEIDARFGIWQCEAVVVNQDEQQVLEMHIELLISKQQQSGASARG